jgi:hypothetical protein
MRKAWSRGEAAALNSGKLKEPGGPVGTIDEEGK